MPDLGKQESVSVPASDLTLIGLRKISVPGRTMEPAEERALQKVRLRGAQNNKTRL